MSVVIPSLPLPRRWNNISLVWIILLTLDITIVYKQYFGSYFVTDLVPVSRYIRSCWPGGIGSWPLEWTGCQGFSFLHLLVTSELHSVAGIPQTALLLSSGNCLQSMPATYFHSLFFLSGHAVPTRIKNLRVSLLVPFSMPLFLHFFWVLDLPSPTD